MKMILFEILGAMIQTFRFYMQCIKHILKPNANNIHVVYILETKP